MHAWPWLWNIAKALPPIFYLLDGKPRIAISAHSESLREDLLSAATKLDRWQATKEELIADGNIHVYAPLRGRALAGARGNGSARIFTQTMEAELLSIAGVYRTLEQALPDNLQGRPCQVYLENERLVITALGQ